MPVIVIGTLAYALLGLVCVAEGVRTRRGVGEYKLSRGVKVSYEKLPLRERTRTANALLVLGAALLLCSPFSLLPEPAIAALFLLALCCFIAYVVIQAGLRRAAQAVVRDRTG